MKDKVLQTIRDNSMFSIGDKVIVAVSGGADSMSLLNILYEVKDQLKITIAVAHINHCLRGKDSDEDEAFVEDFCIKNDIEVYIKKVDINKLAEELGISSESAGREARYTFFNFIKEKINAQKIALAHNANDQAETLLMHIMRGSGMEGLTGIKPVRDNIYVRPLINIKREEIEQYCALNEIKYRTDKTNFENIYARNKVRLELVPYIKTNFNNDIVSTLSRLADTIRKDNEYLDSLAEKKYKNYCENDRGKVIIYKRIFLEEEAILTRIIRRAILGVKGDLNNLEKVHIYDIINIQKNNTGKKVSLPGNLQAYNNYGDIIIYDNNKNKICKDIYKSSYILKNDNNNIDSLGLKIQLRNIKRNEITDFKTNGLTKYFDADKIKDIIILRFRREGDRFTPIGMTGSKKLKDLFIDLKVPKEERDKIPLICFENEIAWVVGYQISNKFKVNNETKNILEISIEEGNS
ncbi:MAG: tRNA lysidine(34) synthetase TilS [Bacillota bacterium]|nr:tRNA lysidine(34) synthetase TilS [Bacillota bacterium]